MLDKNTLPPRSHTPYPFGHLLPTLGLCVAVSMVGFALHYSGYGFDFTDEGFYLLWLKDPGAYHIHVPLSFFGFVYHPLHQLLHGDVMALRQSNILLVVCLAWALSHLLLRSIWPRAAAPLLLVSAAGLASLSLGYFALWWLVTPSYNSLTFQGMLLTFVGALMSHRNRSWRSAAGWACIALGGWLVFMAKPSSALLLAPSVLAYLIASGKRDVPMLLATVALSMLLLFVSAMLMDGSVVAFGQRIIESIDLLRVLGSGQDFARMLRLEGLPLGIEEYALLAMLIMVLLVGAYGLFWTSEAPLLLAFCGCLLGVAAMACMFWPGAPVIPFGASVLIGAPIAGVVFAILRGREGLTLLRPQLPIALLLIAAPYIYTFGTNGNYWTQGSAVGFFWVLAAVALLAPLLEGKMASASLWPLILLFQFLGSCLLVQGISAPYRQELSFRAPHVPWDLAGNGRIMVSRGFGQYLASSRRLARVSGFDAGEAMIDLTGRSPGLLYELGALSPGQPWLVGAYPGSDALAVASLRTETCEALAGAWLLVEPSGPRSLTVESVLKSWGATLDRDYSLAGSVQTAKQAGGYPDQYIQNLFKPIRPLPIAAGACERARGTEPRTGYQETP
jgi:hypothetical protein